MHTVKYLLKIMYCYKGWKHSAYWRTVFWCNVNLLKVHSCAQTWYLSILKCDSRVVVHSSIWTLCIPKCAYVAHKTCFTLKRFDLGNHRNMYLHNARASTDMPLWTCTYTYVRAHWIVKTWPNRELFELENIHVYFSFKGQYNINEYLYEKRDSGLKRKKINWSTLIRTHADPPKIAEITVVRVAP